MDFDESSSGKGMDLMAKWEQHYYTWSTNSLSGSRVGLGIVADSQNHDRNPIRIMESQGARSEVCREEEGLTVERLSYSSELPGYVRTGATPCRAGADLRNNKFVHIYSMKASEELMPEEYLAPLPYEKQWDGNSALAPYESFADPKETGREGVFRILDVYGLAARLPELFCCVYRCLLSGEKPLSIVDGDRAPAQFGEFSRQVMLLIHSMIPPYLRKEADYVSYAVGGSQEAHFLFRREKGGLEFDMHHAGQGKKEYALLEKEFYIRLSELFLRGDSSFGQFIQNLDHFLMGLSDKRNCLEKCVFAFMASDAGKEKDKKAFFTGVERLMYWARKDESLLPAIREATKDLDFRSMDEDELLSYTGLLLTGAGGRTEGLAYGELNRMLQSFYAAKDSRFGLLLERISKANEAVYMRMVQDGDEEYRRFVAGTAYGMYQKAKSAEKRRKLETLGKTAERKWFVKLKQKDVENVLEQARSIEEFFAVSGRLDLENMEEPIRKMICGMALEWFFQENRGILPEPGSEGQMVRELLFLGEKLSESERIRNRLTSHYEKMLDPVFLSMDAKSLVGSEFAVPEGGEFEIYREILAKKMLDCYIRLAKERKEDFYRVDLTKWLGFVLKISGAWEKKDREKAKEAIALTRSAIIEKRDIIYFAKANEILERYGAPPIACPKKLWESVELADFSWLYREMKSFHAVECEESIMYRAMEILSCYKEKNSRRAAGKKLRSLLKEEPSFGEELLSYMALLWGEDESLGLDFFYPPLYEAVGKEEAAKIIKQAAKENPGALAAWKEYENTFRKKAGKTKKAEEKNSPLKNIASDILSESLWAVLLGFYGYLFTGFRGLGMYADSYSLSVKMLVGLLFCYALFTFFGKKKKQTQGAVVYVVGLGLFLMNLALSFEQESAVTVLFAASIVLAFACKVIDFILHRND